MVVGCDPGLRGGVASILDGKLHDVVPMPLAAGEMHPGPLVAYLTSLGHKIDRVFIEHSQAFPKMVGKSTVFNFGCGFGILQGVVGALCLPYTLVKPREWQRLMHKGTDASAEPKARSLCAAYSLFPSQSWLATPKCKKDHDGMIDAALIAYYGYRQMSGLDSDIAPSPPLRMIHS